MARPKPTAPRRRPVPAPPPPPTPRTRRRRPGQRALQEIRKYQSSTRLLLRAGPFSRLPPIPDDASWDTVSPPLGLPSLMMPRGTPCPLCPCVPVSPGAGDLSGLHPGS
ncbi:histone H3-like centromeric protein A isoform X5 [Patagioenas fasciata]|uniref:histone H3-like centromeric protein A isoform X5 n=1 Tax=Patagioenas fasciata TaxID=372321 RepID=UPI003A98FF21